MKIARKLSAGDASEGQWSYAKGSVACVMSETIIDEQRTGIFRQVELGPDGILVHQGTTVIGIPLEEIIALAVGIEPEFANVTLPPVKGTATPRPVKG